MEHYDFRLRIYLDCDNEIIRYDIKPSHLVYIQDQWDDTRGRYSIPPGEIFGYFLGDLPGWTYGEDWVIVKITMIDNKYGSETDITEEGCIEEDGDFISYIRDKKIKELGL
jgi:hypothetical protein